MYALLNIGTALSYNLPMLIIFQFLAGATGSAALSNVAGTIADLFGDRGDAGQPMELFVLAANFGPSLGSPIDEWVAINPHMGLKWRHGRIERIAFNTTHASPEGMYFNPNRKLRQSD